MEYRTLKDIAKITMGQSPDSSSYNDNCDGIPFFRGMRTLEKFTRRLEFGAMILKKSQSQEIY